MRKLIYSNIFTALIKGFLSIFFSSKYLSGKYFEEKRMGYLWALKALPSRFFWGNNSRIPWPIGKNTLVSNAYNIEFDNSSINVFQTPGCYFQCISGKIYIGKEVYIAPNCGLITTNHDLTDPNKHLPGRNIVIGDNCWIGMNSVILPGVVLGANTVVGAGSVVTKSFPEGNLVVAGVPAKIIKKL